jgi:hypothetical protein
MKNGFIKIDKRILEWGWYSDINTKGVFLHLLLKANWKDQKFQNLLVKRGQLVTSVKSLSKDLDLTVKQIRLCLKKLISTNEISIKTTNKYTLINIENYCLYQGNKMQEGQTKGKQRATIEDIKERKNNINPYIPLNSSKAETSGVEKQVLCRNDIIVTLDDKSFELARANAPGWDIYNLAEIYAEGINSGIREKPRSIKAAFPRWCKLYTKGTPP